MAAELLLAHLVFAPSPAEHARHLAHWGAAPGLAAQLVFAVLPVVRLYCTQYPR